MNRWLLKTEPSEYSWSDLWRAANHTGRWDGVRNYQARLNLRKMKFGDRIFIYHSAEKPLQIVGIAEIVREAYPDPTQFDATSDYFDPKSKPSDPRWTSVDVRAVEAFKFPVTMEAMRATPALKNMVLLNNTRLSVQPVTDVEWEMICGLGGMGE
jgi:predicted RNA-binding protein with PUA-like domain